MKPQMLKITGINSFNEEQIIDFSKLLSNGIFGIFGDTGSGKSTIIDCITLALYGKIVRHRNKNGDFINLNRNDAKVLFEFSIKEGDKRKNYSILRGFKKSKEGSIGTSVARLLDLDNNEILADKVKDITEKIENIIGLNYDDFIKAVILPQGKFSEFLMLENLEKRKMLERIFGLEKYGDKLNKKINEKKKEKKEELDKIEEKILLYSEITEEELEEKVNLLKINLDNLKIQNEQLKNILEEEKFFEKKLELKQDYDENLQKYLELLKYKKTVDNWKIELENSKKCNIIKPFLIEFKNIQERKHFLQKEYENISNQKDEIDKEYDFIKQKYEEIDIKFKNELPKLNETKIDLKNCLEIEKVCLELKLEIDKLNKEIIEENQNFQNIEKRKEKFLIQKNDLEKQLELIQNFKKENKIDKTLKENLENCINLINDNENIQNQILKKQDLINTAKNNITRETEILNKNQHILKDIENEKINILISNKINLNQKLTLFDEEDIEILENLENIQSELNLIENSLKLQQNKEFAKELVENLKKDTPCPICGSKNHPNPAKIFLETMSNTLEQNKANFLKKIEKLNLEKMQNLKNKTIINQKLERIEKELEKFDLSNIENNFFEKYVFENIDEILNQKNSLILNISKQNAEIKANIKNYENNIQLEENEIKILKNQINQINEKIQEIKNEFKIQDINKEYEKIIKIQSIIEKKQEENENLNNLLKNISLELEDLQNHISNSEKIITKNQTLLNEKNNILNENNNKLINKNYNQNFNEQLNKLNQEIDYIQKQENLLKKQFEKISSEKQALESNFNKILTEKQLNEKTYDEKYHNLKSMLDEYNVLEQEILEKSLDKKDEDFRKNKIISFEEKFNTYKINLKNIQNSFFQISKENINTIDLDILKSFINKILEKRNFIENEKEINSQNIAKLNIEIEKAKFNLQKTKDLIATKKQLIKKYDILEELSKLNQGNLFVEYVANSQLKQIVFDASKRLENMSLNKYSLQLINNEFTIKDNFNGGILRSVRSLSGGEIFMASLSLALSLSTKIQLKNKAPLEVFFLDEGFGTLDSNILDIVINTLENLQYDNIDVGIITHVEEIKNRVINKIIVSNTDNSAKILIK